MNPKMIVAALAVVGIGAWFYLKDGQSSDPAEATRQATALAVKELKPLLEDATSKAQTGTRQDLVDWNRVADNAFRAFQSKSAGRKNLYEVGAQVFVVGPAGTRPGTVYLDSSHATADGVVLVTGIYREKGTNAIRDDARSLSVSSGWKPKPGKTFEDHNLIQGL